MEKKVALVTAGIKGIGKACARSLADRGYYVAIHFRSNPERALELAKEIGHAKIFQYDLLVEGACEDLIKDVKGEFGRIDVLVNNAGVAIDQLIPFAKADDFNTMMNTNLKAVFLLCKFASKQMIRQKKGNIINITSILGYTGNGGQSIYSATKGAVTALTKSMAKELAGFGIRCNCVAPGFIATDMTASLSDEIQKKILDQVPLKRMGCPEEVGAVAAFLASEEASYITGSTLHVNGGMYTN